MTREKRPRVITTRVTEGEGRALDDIAALDHRNVAELTYFAIQEYIARRKAGAPVTPTLAATPFAEDPEFAWAWSLLPAQQREAIRGAVLDVVGKMEDPSPAEEDPPPRKRSGGAGA